MEHAHALERGAIGLDSEDGKGEMVMIDAPMIKQVWTCYVKGFM